MSPALPHVMGIVNLTPDSFSDGGMWTDSETAITAALRLEAGGATILDLGAESTRPGSLPISAREELGRLLPVLEGLRPRTRAVISIDTRKSAVARVCLERGADWINDVSALRFDPKMREVAAEFDVPLVLMHMRGEPATMQDAPTYQDVVREVRDELAERVQFALAGGIRAERLLLDPGLGFGKRFEDNLELLRRLGELQELGAPLVVGASRKGFLGRALSGAEGAAANPPPPAERDIATLAALAICTRAGVSVHRVHHARYASEFLRVLRVLGGR